MAGGSEVNSPAQAIRLAFDENSFSVYFADGRILNVPLAFFPRLLNADQNQREHYELSGGGTGIHWDDLDEDISVEGLLLGVGDRTRRHLDPSRKSA
jgi:hypothetical protein